MIVGLVLLAIPALSLLFLQNRQVQTLVSRTLSNRIAETLGNQISIGQVNYSFFKRIQIRDLYVEDPHGDTLLFSELAKVRIKQLRPDRGEIEIRKISLENSRINLVIDSAGVINLSFFIDRIKKPHVPPEMKSTLKIASIDLMDSRFTLSRMGSTPDSSGIDFAHLRLDDFRLSVEDLTSSMDTVTMHIRELSGRERSGFDLQRLTSVLSLGKKHMHFRDLEIRTPGSALHIPGIGFNFPNYQGFKHFSSQVRLKFHSDRSILHMPDLAQFVPAARGLQNTLVVDGHIAGRLNDLRGDDLIITSGERSALSFDFVMIGLPDIRTTFMDFNFRELSTSAGALSTLLSQQTALESKEDLYPLTNLGNLRFRGDFTGYPDDFVATGLLRSGLGSMVLDLSFKPDSVRGIDFNGRLRTRNFRLGRFLSREDDLGRLDMNVRTSGNLYRGRIRADMQGSIDTLEFNGYAYSSIELDGAFTNTKFDGGFRIRDPNLRMDFLGRMDFSGEVPVYNFTADVGRARPYFLNLTHRDPSYFASFLVETNMSGESLDGLNGEIRLVNSLFEREDAQVQLYDLRIITRNTPDSSMLRIRSDALDADLTGRYMLTGLQSSFRQMADRFVNLIPGNKVEADTLTRISYQVDFKHMEPVLDFFMPYLGISDGSSISGTYRPRSGHHQAMGYLSKLSLAGNDWTNVELFSEVRNGEFFLQFQSDSMTYRNAYTLVDQQLDFRAAKDTARLEITWNNRMKPRHSGSIGMFGSFRHDTLSEKGFLIHVKPGQVYTGDELWKVEPSTLLIGNQLFRVDSLALRTRNRHLIADGSISARREADFGVEVKQLDLGDLAALTGIPAELGGLITGNMHYSNRGDYPRILADLEVDTLLFNGQALGATSLSALWNESTRTIGLDISARQNGLTAVDIAGEYVPEEELLDFALDIRNFHLAALDRYIPEAIEDLSGTADLSMTLDGTVAEPEVNGSVTMNNGAATFRAFHTRYVCNDPVRIYRNNLYFDDFRAEDRFGNSATVSGSITSSHLREFYTSLSIEADQMLFMDTGAEANEEFYGTIFATGNARITGSPGAMKIDVSATTDRNTAVFFPLYRASEVKTTDYLTFVKEEEFEPEEAEEIPLIRKTGEGPELDLDVSVTPDAVVQLIFDPQVGDIIETRGRGNLRIMRDEVSGFRIFGDVELVSGDYLFTLQNVINKRFQIEQGGRIAFNGEPREASIDLDAIYETRAAPYNLYPGERSEAPESLKKRIPVECHLDLQGELQSPTITTGIQMPTADSQTRDLLENRTSTEEELMKQFLSLLVINNFYSVAGSGAGVGSMNSSLAGVTASELLSNQLSNWLSQISSDFDIGVNYRPGDQISSDEVEVALSTQLLNDRIIISGNVDVGGQETSPSTATSANPYIVGDVDVEFKVTDNISVTAFNRARDELIFETAPYKQGVGVSFREDFDTLGDLLDRYREGLTNRKKKKKKPGEPELDD